MPIRFFHLASQPVLGVKSEPKRPAKSLDFSISIGPVTVCFLFLTAENHEPRADSASSFCWFVFVFATCLGWWQQCHEFLLNCYDPLECSHRNPHLCNKFLSRFSGLYSVKHFQLVSYREGDPFLWCAMLAAFEQGMTVHFL